MALYFLYPFIFLVQLLFTMEVEAVEEGFVPYVSEAILGPNRSILNALKNIVTKYPSFAKTMRKRCLGPCAKLVRMRTDDSIGYN